MAVHVDPGYLCARFSKHLGLLATSIFVADFAKLSLLGALDMAVTRSATIVPLPSGPGPRLCCHCLANGEQCCCNTGFSNCGGRRFARRQTCSALRGVCPLPGSLSKRELQSKQKIYPAFTSCAKLPRPGRGAAAGAEAKEGYQPA